MEYINKLLHRAIPARTPSPTLPSGNDTSLPKTAEHEVKVRFAREFADVGSITYSAPESLSSASSFHSLSSTLSTKSSSGICADSVPLSPNDASNISYVNSNIPGVEDLIIGCGDIQLHSDGDPSFNTSHNSQDLSQDQTFASATDEPTPDITKDSWSEISQKTCEDVTEAVEDLSTTYDSTRLVLDRTQNLQDRPILSTVCVRAELPITPCALNKNDSSVLNADDSGEGSISPNRSHDITSGFKSCVTSSLEENSLSHTETETTSLNCTVCSSGDKSCSDVIKPDEDIIVENISSNETSIPNVSCPTINSISSVSVSTENAEEDSFPSIPTLSTLIEESDSKLSETSVQNLTENVNFLPRSSSPVNNIGTTADPSSLNIPQNPVLHDEKDSSCQINVSSTSGNATSVGDNCTSILNDTSTSIISETPIIQKEVEENIDKQLELTSDTIALQKDESSSQGEDGVVIENFASSKGEDLQTVVNNKLHELPHCEELEDFKQPNVKQVEEEKKENSAHENLDSTLTLQDVSFNAETIPEIEQYAQFQPQRQSTELVLTNEQQAFDELKSAAEKVANDIFKSSFESTEESDPFISATSEIFQDPTSFDFLLARSSSRHINRLRAESLYVKFDPLVSDISMLPQGNSQPINEEQNGKNENPLPHVETPKRNPAIAAIDRLLFYSPISTSTIQKTEEPLQKIEQPMEEPKTDTAITADINMSKELELVRATVLQLEEELEKQKKEYEAELEKQKNAFQEKINKLQAQMAQEVKSKSQMTVVVEEYEKSISRLLTERERDRTNYEQEKAKLQEELQAANVHLTNTEAAFNDVHQKYERLKGVVSAYKSNETVLKESIQENMETIKGLETRYDQLKNHAMTQLEKANFELDGIRKQHEDETVKLHAMVRKAELKSNSLAELVEQKTKENKELTQILDEVIARVGHQNAE